MAAPLIRAVVTLCLMAGLAGGAAAHTPTQSLADTPDTLRAEAFEAAQWAIASDAADALAKVSARFAQGDDALGRIADERETLISTRDRLERELERLYADPAEAALTRRTAARIEYETALNRLKAVDADIEVRFPAYSELTSPRALSVAETQALLKPDEGLLLVLVNPEATYVWGVSHDRIEWARADNLGAVEMAAAVDALRQSLTTAARRTRADPERNPGRNPVLYAGRPAAPFDRAVAHRLYEQLVAPVEPVFAGKTTLITVVTGPLTTLPLAVLTTEAPAASGEREEAGEGAWLIDRYALATLPSVSSLKALRCHLVADPAQRSSGCPSLTRGDRQGRTATPTQASTEARLAAFGAPILAGAAESGSRSAPDSSGLFPAGRLADVEKLRALPYLPGSLAELESLQARYPSALVRVGAAATESAVRHGDAEALSRARFVVFSTHGLMAGPTVPEPGLVMTPPAQASEADDGYLGASEVAQLRLQAQFVVLSACNTAASDGRPGGEGLSGLARAFFYAGARSVLVSHWEVSDAATTALISDTFAALDASDAGADIGDRARALQSGMRAVRAHRAWSHPAFWAPFTLVGEPG